MATLMPFGAICLAQSASNTRTLSTVCIDAGHGGNDAGCTRKEKGTVHREKEMTLYIAKELAKQIKTAYPEVNVVLTRGKDEYVKLGQRGKIANNAKADLFISIHIDATKNTSARGFSIHCLGQSRDKNRDLFKYNMDVCRRENEVFSLDDDKPESFDPEDPSSAMIFSLMQNVHLEQSLSFAEEVQKEMRKGPIKTDRGVWQNPFMVLWVTSMPSVLIECGFISNEKDLNVLKTEDGKKKIAEAIFRAFKTYKTNYDNMMAEIGTEAPQEQMEQVEQPEKVVPAKAGEVKVAVETTETEGKTLYGVQVMASGRLLKENDKSFKGYKATIIQTGKLYKYILGATADEKKAREFLKTIKKTFPDSFLVKTDGKEVERVR